ncbi:Arc family DNA-binding protein [Kitasatospora sp. NPDC094028]
MIKYTLRSPDDLWDRLAVQAATDRRSINSEILYLLEVALNAVAPQTPVRLDGESAMPEPLRGKPDSPTG